MYLKISLLILWGALLGIKASEQNKNNYLNNLIDRAVRLSPIIKMLEAKKSVSASKIEQGTNLPDPVLTVGLVNMPVNSFSFTQEPMTGKIIGLSQNIPFPGGLGASADAKAINTLILVEEIRDEKKRLRRSMSILYHDLSLVREKLKLNDERIILLRQQIALSKRNYEVSEESYQNVIQIDVKLTKIKDRNEKLKGKEALILTELNSYLFADPKSQINTEFEDTGFDEFEGIEKLQHYSLINQPKLNSISLAEKRAQLKEEEAEYLSYPNFNLSLQYSKRDHNELTGISYKDFFSIMAGITLTINYGGKKNGKFK